MPRPFTETERETIRAKLMKAGRACFLRYGLKKTTIEDLTRPAGIAKASFYLFFDSKEKLFLEVFLLELPAMMERIMAASFGSTKDTREALIRLMRAITHEMESNQFSRMMLDNPSELRQFASSIDYEAVLQQVSVAYMPIVEKIAEAQTRGEIIEGDPFKLSFSLGLVKMLPLNRESLPEPLYLDMVELAPRIIAAGLTNPSLGAYAYAEKDQECIQQAQRKSLSTKSKGGIR